MYETNTNRSFTIDYEDPGSQNTTDVSFELTNGAEDVLFTELGHEINSEIESGIFPDQIVHLTKRLTKQRAKHPPWVDVDDRSRVYDIELSEWDYHIVTVAVGKSLKNILGPEAADRYIELVSAWESITEQMVEDDTITELDEESEPMTGTFQCFMGDGEIAVYENDGGDTWYRCNECETSFTEIDDDHECEQYR